ncbi:MAG: elongation factor P-like protein YeiP [Endozoicomonas sp. (ex Botrylloides leachii)]|nr:elongation factor P-like protein YeiP [Endozoicomonas sp. (ex Botrylloides leachii)]
MPYARELKKGQIVAIDSQYYLVRQVDTKRPSARGAQTLYKVRFCSVPAGKILSKTLTGDDLLADINLLRRPVSLLYKEGNEYTFMDNEDYTQYAINADIIKDVLPYIHEGQENITALFVEDQLLCLELPGSVSLKIIETAPAVKGASAAARSKPALLVTGLEVQVPEYLREGEWIKINTETGKFMSRS